MLTLSVFLTAAPENDRLNNLSKPRNYENLTFHTRKHYHTRDSILPRQCFSRYSPRRLLSHRGAHQIRRNHPRRILQNHRAHQIRRNSPRRLLSHRGTHQIRRNHPRRILPHRGTRQIRRNHPGRLIQNRGIHQIRRNSTRQFLPYNRPRARHTQKMGRRLLLLQ